MSNFRLIRANDESQVEILASMHHLRWEVFSKELKWTVGAGAAISGKGQTNTKGKKRL